MFKIELAGIGGDKQVTDFTTTVETLAEAEVIAAGEVGGYLGTYDFELVHIDGLMYEIACGEQTLGVVQITVL